MIHSSVSGVFFVGNENGESIMLETIVLVRHGESTLNYINKQNIGRIFIGQADTPLTYQGVQQAIACTSYFDHQSFDAYYSSCLSRARDTAKYATANRVPIIQDERINERSLGKFEGGLLADLRLQYPDFDFNQPFNLDEQLKAIDGENLCDVYKRVQNFWTEILSSYNRVAVFSHSIWIKMTLAFLLKQPISEAKRLSIPNGQILELKYIDGHWQYKRS